MSGRYLLRGGCVLTLGARTQNLPVGDVLIEDGRIAEVGEGIRSRNAEVIDASDSIVMPGFVDAHRHSWKTLFRNLDGHADRTKIGDADLSPDDAYAATLAGLLGAIEAGITTVVDWVDPPSVDSLGAIVDAHRDAATRTVAVLPATLDALTLRAALDRKSQHTTFALEGSSTGPADADPRLALAQELGLRLHYHVGVDGGETGLITELDRARRLGDHVTLVHCSAVSDAELAAIAAAGSSVVMTPAAEMAGGLGSPPIQRLIDKGIRPGLGIGDESAAPGDMFAQMRATNSFQHASMFDLKLSGRAGVPQPLTTREVLRYATIDGAFAVGSGQTIGSLEPGKRGDLLVLRADLPNVHPVNDPIGAVVWGMDTSNISWVFVEGNPVLSDGQANDEHGRARDLAVAAQRRLISSGLSGDAG